MSRNIPGFFSAFATVIALGGFRGGGENTFGLGGIVLLEEGVFDRVDADLRITGGDLTLGLRTTPETVRLRTGVGTAGSLDLADKVEMGDLVEAGREDCRRCGVVFAFWSWWASGLRRGCLDEDSDAGVSDFAWTRRLDGPSVSRVTDSKPELRDIRRDCRFRWRRQIWVVCLATAGRPPRDFHRRSQCT